MTAVTVASLIAEAEEVRRKAMEAGQYSAAIAAIHEKGVLSGKRVERSEREAPGEFDWLETLSPDELRAVIAGKVTGPRHDKPH
jgi:phage terminase small subunit